MSTIYGDPIIISPMEGGTAVSVQDTKAVTITSNGTVSVTPDAPYDVLKQVDVKVNVASGGGGAVSSGYSVTFPATANNWNQISDYATLVLSDGSTVDFKDYSVVAGRTINNVIEIRANTIGYYLLTLTLTAGAIVVSRPLNGGMLMSAVRIAAPGSTPIYYAATSHLFSFMPVEDIIISAIELTYTYD